MKSAILLSGGIDSTALAYLYRNKLSLAMTVDYGQRSAEAEIRVSRIICKELNLKHKIINVDCSSLGSGEMAKTDTRIPIAPSSEWWPYRNQLLITFGSMYAINYNIDTLLLGSVKTDFKHLDGTPEFFEAFNKVLSMQEGYMKVAAPAITLSSFELVKKSQIPSSLLLWAHSCHIANTPCGHCNGCNKYTEVISELELE